MEILSEHLWRARAQEHAARVTQWVSPHLRRQSMGQKEPVVDFLFSYYSLRPSYLMKWTPGLGVMLTGKGVEEFLGEKHFHRTDAGVTLDCSTLAPKRIEGLRFIWDLLRATVSRPAQFACHGLHEWAMVYRAPEIRHAQFSLRLSPEQIARLVETQTLCCTHYDAFRFFSPEARPLNQWTLDRSDQLTHDQPGCLHANMDLYKWAYKLLPWIASELVADCFELALAARIIDMRASPYDLRAMGYDPIPIETPQGREEYAAAQRQIAHRAEALRQRLIVAYETVISEVNFVS